MVKSLYRAKRFIVDFVGRDGALKGQKDAVGKMDMGRALAAWDSKMAGKTRSMLNTVLYNYIALENILSRAKESVVQDQNYRYLKFYT